MIINEANPAERFTVTSNALGLWSYTLQTTRVGSRRRPFRRDFTVEQNYPNPFNPSTNIPFTTPAPGTVTMSVYNSIGQRLDERTYTLDAGSHTVRWTASGAAGMLFYSIAFGDIRLTRKMVQLDGHGSGGLGDAVTSGRRCRRDAARQRPVPSLSRSSRRSSSTCRIPPRLLVQGDATVDTNSRPFTNVHSCSTSTMM